MRYLHPCRPNSHCPNCRRRNRLQMLMCHCSHAPGTSWKSHWTSWWTNYCSMVVLKIKISPVKTHIFASYNPFCLNHRERRVCWGSCWWAEDVVGKNHSDCDKIWPLQPSLPIQPTSRRHFPAKVSLYEHQPLQSQGKKSIQCRNSDW